MSVALPETDVVRVRRWCVARVPEHVRDRVRVEVDVADRHLTIVECRPLGPGSDWSEELLAEVDQDPTAIFWG